MPLIKRGSDIEPTVDLTSVYVSRLNCYNSCKRKDYWTNVRNLEPRAVRMPFFVGGSFHTGIQIFYDGFKPDEVLEMVDEYMENEVSKMFVPPQDLQELEKNKTIVRGMLMGYMKVHALEQKKWNVIVTEQSVVIALNGLDLDLIGTIDMVYEETKKVPSVKNPKVKLVKKSLKIGEHKTASAMALSNGYFERLDMDMQINTYFLLAERGGLGKIDAINYNVVQKPMIRLKNNETYEEFLERIEMEYSENEEKYFHRKTLDFKPKLFDENFKEVVHYASDLKRHYENGPDAVLDKTNWPKNTKSCYEYNSRCPFFDLCRFGETKQTMLMFKEREGTDRGHIIKGKAQDIDKKPSKNYSNTD